MGVGFVIIIWLTVFIITALVYLFFHSLAKNNEGAADLKKAFLWLIGIGSIALITLFVFAIGNVCLDYFYPSRIFTKNFGFEPTADVRIIEGSSFWTPFGYSSHLKFQANEETVQKIVIKDFSERSKSSVNNFDSVQTKEILQQPQSRLYERNDSGDETLAYDKQSKNAYFSFQTVD